jgi:sodium transport system ATP-binding protein
MHGPAARVARPEGRREAFAAVPTRRSGWGSPAEIRARPLRMRLDPARSSTPTVMIRFTGLTKRYGPLTAVEGLTLEVAPGEAFALLGPNGAGKTTALRCLAALMRPSEGTASVCGHDVVSDPLGARARLAFLSSSMGLYERLTSREVISYFGGLHGLGGTALESRVNDLVTLFGIGPFEQRMCGRLSTGQRQRVALARALVHDPPALILDEPTLGLDVLAGRTIHDFIQRERARGKSILFSTHQMEEVELLADRVGVLRGGRLVAVGSPSDLLAATGTRSLVHAFLALVEAE